MLKLSDFYFCLFIFYQLPIETKILIRVWTIACALSATNRDILQEIVLRFLRLMVVDQALQTPDTGQL